MLAVALLMLAVSLAGAVLALTDRSMSWPLRAIWAVACLFGIGKFYVNWTAGGGDVFPISIQLPAILLFGTPGANWFVAFAIPVFALYYLGRRYIPSSNQSKGG